MVKNMKANSKMKPMNPRNVSNGAKLVAANLMDLVSHNTIKIVRPLLERTDQDSVSAKMTEKFFRKDVRTRSN